MAKKSAGQSADMSLADIIRLLEAAEGSHDPLCVVAGPEEALRRLVVEQVFASPPDGTDMVRISAESREAAADIAEAVRPSLLTERTWLHVHGLEEAGDEARAAVERALPAIGPGLRILLEHAGGNQGTGLLRAAERAGARMFGVRQAAGAALVPLLVGYADERGGALQERAAALMVDLLGNDLAALFTAAEQMSLDSETGIIDTAQVRATLAGAGITDMWQVADMVWKRDTGAALESFRRLVEQEGPRSAGPKVAIALSATLRPLAKYVGDRPTGQPWQVASAIGAPARKVPLIKAQAALWTEDELLSAAALLAGIQAAMKGGLEDGAVLDTEQKLFVLERLIIDLARREP